MQAKLAMGQGVIVPRTEGALTAAVVAGMALVIALCAQIQIRLPFTPVPLTGSTLGVLYAGALLGSRRGAAAVGLYLLMGSVGLPFFAGGASGAGHMLGATGGYLAGFIPAAWLCGKLSERGWDRTPLTAFAQMALSSTIVFACGLVVLSFYVPKGELLAKGLFPFVLGDLFKSALSAALLPAGRRFIER